MIILCHYRLYTTIVIIVYVGFYLKLTFNIIWIRDENVRYYSIAMECNRKAQGCNFTTNTIYYKRVQSSYYISFVTLRLRDLTRGIKYILLNPNILIINQNHNIIIILLLPI